MKIKPLLKQSAALLALFLITGCAATTAGRIKQKADVFAALSQEDQDSIKQGKVKIGFTSDMVYMALGKPDRKYIRRTADGVSTVWAYTARISRSEMQPVRGTFRVRVPGSGYRTVTDTVPMEVNHYIDYDRLRIELRDNKVTAIEEAQPGGPSFF